VRVQLRVEPLDPLEVLLDELDRRGAAAADELRLLRRAQEGELAHSVRSAIRISISGPSGGAARYCSYFCCSSSSACSCRSVTRAVPRSRTHHRRDQSSS